jgi:hypothetical protein
MHQMQSVIQDKTKPSILYNIIQYIWRHPIPNVANISLIGLFSSQ